MRSPEPRNSANRRSGHLPGRRFAFTLALLLAVAAACAGSASADQTVVSATVYASAQGGVSHPSVGVQALSGCPAYDGSNPIYLYPAGQPYQLTSTSWSLSTVLTCGLHIPLGDLTNVQVLDPSPGQGFEVPLSSADLSDPAQYQDPNAPDALPAISVDGSENQTTYIRPFRGGSDDNARDQVTENGEPITLIVYANGPPLVVKASAQTLSSTATMTTAKFDATVQTANGSPVPASALTWSWSFGDGASAASATPTHQFAAGSYDVTVEVTDASSGMGGTATVQFITPATPAPGSQKHHGGTRPGKSRSPTGTANGTHGTRPAGRPGSDNAEGSANGPSNARPPSQPTNPASASQPSTPTTPAAPTTSPAPAEATTTSSSTTTSSAASTAGSSSSHRPATHTTRRRSAPRRTPPPAGPAGTLVNGRLISDVTPLPVGSSPLVHLAPAAAAAPPAVQQATRTTNLSALGAALVVGVLLGLGAWRELRGRRRSRAVLPGH